MTDTKALLAELDALAQPAVYGRRYGYSGEIAKRAAAAIRELLGAAEVLRLVEFAGIDGKCPLCSGWDCSDRGETPRAHTDGCELAQVLRAARSQRGSGEE